MNVELLEKVEERIRTRPEIYNQGNFFWWPGQDVTALINDTGAMGKTYADQMDRIEDNGWQCGAAACVAGHAVALSGRIREFLDPYDGVDWTTAGATVLDIDLELADWLFDMTRIEAAMPEILKALREGADFERLEEIEASFDTH